MAESCELHLLYRRILYVPRSRLKEGWLKASVFVGPEVYTGHKSMLGLLVFPVGV